MICFNKRKYCNRLCMARAFDLRHKPEEQVGYAECHARARRIVGPGSCGRCGAKNARDVHHKNGDWRDNNQANLERICRSCHNRVYRKRKPCTICGKPQKGLGFCEKHYQRFKKHGDPLAVKINQHTPVRKEVGG